MSTRTCAVCEREFNSDEDGMLQVYGLKGRIILCPDCGIKALGVFASGLTEDMHKKMIKNGADMTITPDIGEDDDTFDDDTFEED